MDIDTIANLTGISSWILIILLIWTLSWKGYAMWIAARKKQPIWFVCIFIINTFGILEILYIFYFSKEKSKDKNKIRKIRKR